ncbi:MAG TPA: pentapeptide repeat-containing protein [Polyangiales bacterium]|nr:pentapeptide repeat-containing protein [Polyangiales bacterium]
MAHWDAATKRWLPGVARLLRWRVSAEACKDIGKNPPWLLLSGLTAAPSVLLTWYWRDKKRRNDHELALQVAFSGRFTKAAELLAHADEMTRINGLESLWDIALQSAAHRAAVSRTFAAFVRTRSGPMPNPEAAPEVGILGRAETTTEKANTYALRADVQQAMTLLGRSEWADWTRTHAELDLRSACLMRLDLRKAQLKGANLQNADLREAKLQGADLQHANLEGANLERAHLFQANLELASLYTALLGHADLRKAKLKGAALQAANLEHAQLYEANFVGVNLQGAKLQRADLERARLENVDLRFANLEGANLKGAVLRGANLERANLKRAWVADAKLDGARNANLEGTFQKTISSVDK